MSTHHDTHDEYDRPSEGLLDRIRDTAFDAVLGAILLLLAWFALRRFTQAFKG